MAPDSPGKFTMADLRAARISGRKIPMLTCYDYTIARLMHQAGVPALLVGDTASNVILGHSTTLPISLDFLITLTAAVRKGAPDCLLMADMPFGSYHASVAQGVKNVTRMVQLSGCNCVKIEAAPGHAKLIARLADAGVAMVAHLGLQAQSIQRSGRYRAQGRTACEAKMIVKLSKQFERAGASAILLEAVPPQVSQAVVEAVSVPVIGCGAGPACHSHVFVTYDAIGWTTSQPKFVPKLGDMATPMINCFRDYVRLVESGQYPGAQHAYEMPEDEKRSFAALARQEQN
jgi:3-methyl-2-oxobutanoate hydroxymethyltransferase